MIITLSTNLKKKKYTFNNGAWFIEITIFFCISADVSEKKWIKNNIKEKKRNEGDINE